MKISKYLLLIMITVLLYGGLSNASIVNAVEVDQPTPDETGLSSDQNTPDKPSNIFTLQNPLKVKSIGGLINAFLEILTYIFIIFAVLMFIYVGFQYVTNAAQGNAKKIEELHKQLLWLVIGVAVVIGARVIIQVVINTISATGTVSPTIIEQANKAAQGK